MTIYDYEVTSETGVNYALAKYQGHPMIIVNTATKCGFAPQFKQLEALYQTYKDQGLVVLGFPSNQFHQEIADSQDAAAACRMTYGVSFPMHAIHDVNGQDALPLFTYLEKTMPGHFGSRIKWNFTKFLVDAQGNVVKRYAPETNPLKMKPMIESVLSVQK
ncbi:glutathione peroxidase [Agrilactobacillus composti DSM 18527 = JCM 14202]|uniref:Glutathione peroxidase n=1 Tax=Agrilactobacillus composti DSM 18527 = JCM 14202 TaxID=1423734 RepID=A0A0R1Y3F6_9LACO|nr:glutathione peroxidase [Agrilactobacillus composti]KRM34665.1 glutathione peroxidase [Agrilactobacillus composti DSM 18527 = JCM 14202]